MSPEILSKVFPSITWDEPTQSWIVPHVSLLDVVYFLKTDPAFAMDYVSNVTGVDWLDAKVKIKTSDGKEVEEERKGYLEVVYHFYSIQKKQGPVVLRCRTEDRIETMIPSITPLFRGADFQEREIFDLFGIRFSGHPDLRRILMWDEFEDFPMRKDYKEPDDYEWEPTPHDEVHDKAKQHYTPAS